MTQTTLTGLMIQFIRKNDKGLYEGRLHECKAFDSRVTIALFSDKQAHDLLTQAEAGAFHNDRISLTGVLTPGNHRNHDILEVQSFKPDLSL